MKHILSVSIEKDLMLEVFEFLRTKKIRTRSELIERALREFMKNDAR